MDKAKVWTIKGSIGLHAAMGFWMGLWRLGVGWFEAETARNLDAAQQDLQDMQRAAGLKPVGVR